MLKKIRTSFIDKAVGHNVDLNYKFETVHCRIHVEAVGRFAAIFLWI